MHQVPRRHAQHPDEHPRVALGHLHRHRDRLRDVVLRIAFDRRVEVREAVVEDEAEEERPHHLRGFLVAQHSAPSEQQTEEEDEDDAEGEAVPRADQVRVAPPLGVTFHRGRAELDHGGVLRDADFLAKLLGVQVQRALGVALAAEAAGGVGADVGAEVGVLIPAWEVQCFFRRAPRVVGRPVHVAHAPAPRTVT